MALKKYRARVLFALAGALMVASVGWAAAIAISNTQALAFGKFVAGSGGAVTVSPAGGRSASGGVILVSSGPGAAAQFIVSGDANATYTITLPVTEVLLTSGANSMAVNNFTSSPSSIGTLGAGGTQTLSVGATLSVGGNQAIGSYSGAFDVTVNYN